MKINTSSANIEARNNRLPQTENKEDKSLNIEDKFTPSSNGSSFGSKIKNLATKALLLALNIPIYSSTPKITDERREKILNSLQPGDILLETHNNYPFFQIAEKIVANSDFTHAAIYEGDGKMIEANTSHEDGKGVSRVDVAEYLNGRMAIQIIRPPYETQEDIKAALKYADSQIGKDYDGSFDYQNSDKQFCSELVAKSLAAMPNKIYTPTTTFLGREIALPDAFREIEGVEVVYNDGTNFWKNQLSHSLSFIGGAVAAGAAACALGPIGITGAFLGGTVLTSVVGGLIQERETVSHFFKGGLGDGE